MLHKYILGYFGNQQKATDQKTTGFKNNRCQKTTDFRKQHISKNRFRKQQISQNNIFQKTDFKNNRLKNNKFQKTTDSDRLMVLQWKKVDVLS